MTDDDICYLSAREALALFGSGSLAPSELMRALIARIECAGPAINAFTDTYFDQALEKAKTADARWRDGSARSLEGIPVAVKDSQSIAGQRTTYGSRLFQDNVMSTTDPMIERLLNAGAIVLGRSTTSEFCMSGISRSSLWGTTFNPWNRRYGAGGSSGGSAAALAAGFTVLATGTDAGGSIRVPASACGVVGYKPPHGRNPDGHPNNLDPYSHCGPLCRSVADTILMQNVTAGPHPLDHHSLPAIPPLTLELESVEGFRIAYSLDLGYRRVDPEVQENTLAALDILRSLGCEVYPAQLGWTEEIDVAYNHWINATSPVRRLIANGRRKNALLSRHAIVLAEMADAATSIDDVHKAADCANRMWSTLGPILAEHHAFICPTMTVPAVPADLEPTETDFRIDGAIVDPEFGYSTTHQFNMLHNCPVIAVPSGFSKSGVPTGIQIVGRTFDDPTVFRLALAFENARGVWYRDACIRPSL
jgi:Asp-tRNA(Asn)/Glu-tRNA(Gln) amidotransferase A subunit family amidase